MKTTRQILAKNLRIMWAVLGSALIHAVLIFYSVSVEIPRVRRPDAGEFQAALVARIAGARKTDAPAAIRAAPKPRVERPASSHVERSTNTTLTVPGPAVSVSPVAASLPPETAPEGEGGSAVRSRVSATETFPQRMSPAFRNIVDENFSDFIGPIEIDQRPEPVNLLIPQIPARVKAYTWIIIAFFIDEEGRVVDAVPVTGGEGFEDFQDEVAAAVRDSEFLPGRRNGAAVKSISFQRIEFRPSEDATPENRLPAPASDN